jgi:glucose-6-phosphate isomerase
VLHTALRRPRGQVLEVDGRDVVADVHEVLDRVYAFADQVRSGRVEGRHGGSHHHRRQHRHRRLRPRPRHGLRGAAALQAGGPGMPLRVQHRPERHLREDGRPRSAHHAVHRRVEDVHHLGDHHQRAAGTRLAAVGARRSGGHRRDGRRPVGRGRKHFVAVSTNWTRWRSSASTPPTCSASGTGSAAATRWTRPSACRSPSPSARRTSRSSWPASTRSTSTSHRAAGTRTCRVLMGLLNVWYVNFFGAAPTPCCPTRSTCTASRPTCSS